MPLSVWDSEVQRVLEQAHVASARSVEVNGQRIEIPTPFPSPADWRDIWIYFVMLDRFNNPIAPPHHLPWDSEWSTFQGGSFAGIRQQLDYFKTLGARGLWLSPLLKNCQFDAGSYHGYGIQNFLAIDPRFSSDPARAQQAPQFVEDELRALVDEAHARGIYVIFDIVLHHTGNVFEYDGHGADAPWSDQPYPLHWRDEQGQVRPDWPEIPPNAPIDAAVWPQELHNKAFFTRQGNAFTNNQIITAGDFYSLKALATDFRDGTGNPVHDTLIRAYNYLIAKYDLDGFRIDTLMYISPAFARIFANSVREFAQSIGKKNFFIFGEVYGSEDQIAHFIGRIATDENDPIGVDAALDYPLFYKLPLVAKGQLAPSEVLYMFEYRKQVECNILSTHGEASNFFVTFLDNHDQNQRFHYRDPNDPQRYDDQLTLAIGCLFTLPGIPCLYYGTEQGLSGSGDRPEAVREALWGKPDAFSMQTPFYQTIQRLTLLRNDQPALRYGRYYFRAISGDNVHFGISMTTPGILAYSRILSDQEVLIIANTSTQESWAGTVIVDTALNAPGTRYHVVFSNKARFEEPGPVVERGTGQVDVTELDGTHTFGPIHALTVNLQPMELQICFFSISNKLFQP